MKRGGRLAALAAILAACFPGTRAAGLPVDPSWSGSPVWDDGQAEVSVYDAERVIYGKPRAHLLRVIVVKEEFSDDLHVKAEPPYEGRALTTVLKLNLASTVQTDNYPYQFLASLFVRRDDPRHLVKATVGSQEWCGNTFKEVLTWGGPPRLHFHSYFDGQGDGERPLPLGEDGLLDEQLLLVLRAASLPAGGGSDLRLADPIVSNQARAVAVRAARASAETVEEVASPLGRIRCLRYAVAREDGARDTYWVEEAFPRSVVKMEAADGRRMILKERARRDYWTRSP